MDIESLRTFLILSETLSFTATSQAMFVAQSTVSSRINELERELKVKLFERTNRTVKLTIQGEKFKAYASSVIDLTDKTLPQISDSSGYERHIRIGCSNTIYECRLKEKIAEHLRENPKDSVYVSIGISSDLNEKIQAGRFDEVYSYIPLKKSGFTCEVFDQDEMVLVADIAHKKHKSITAEELIGEKYLMCDFALREVGEFVRNIFPEHHRFPIEIDDCTKAIELLKGSDFYTFLPGELAAPLIKSKQLRKIRLDGIKAPIINCYIIRRENAPTW